MSTNQVDNGRTETQSQHPQVQILNEILESEDQIHQYQENLIGNLHGMQYYQASVTSQGRSYGQSWEVAFSEDNSSIHLPKHNNPSLKLLKLITNEMASKSADFAYMWSIWNYQDRTSIIQAFEFIVRSDSWSLFKYEFEKPLEMFLHIYNAKMAGKPYIDQIYPGLPELVRKIESAIEIKGIKNKVRPEERNSDLLYQHFLEEIESKSKREGAYYIRDEAKNKKVPIGDFIAQSNMFEGSHAWSDIFFKSSILKKREEERKFSQDAQVKKERENRTLIKEEILKNESLVLPPDDHLCCAQFFYFIYKIYDQVVTTCPLLTERNFSGLKDANEVYEVILDICGLLNSGGGVILFNTYKNYLQIWPKGETILLSQFIQGIEAVEKNLKYIFPPVKLGEEIFISYVPVVRNPISTQISSEERERSYIQGLYVMRIVVKPSDSKPEQLYFTSRGEDFRIPIVKNNRRKLIEQSQISKFMKKRFYFYYIPETDYDSEEERNMLKKTYSHFTNHPTCLKPEEGLVMLMKIQETIQTSDKQLEGKYKYLTLLVANRNNYPVIQERLRAKGIDCEIVIKYNQYKFRAANNSAALFHNTRFDILLTEVAYKKEYEFNGRFILTILVTNYIKLLDRNKGNILPLDDFTTLQNWLRAEHPNEKLTLWRFEENKDTYEFYLQTESKLSTLFMYYVLNHYNEKCSLKNPKNFERMSQGDKEEKIKLHYPQAK